MEKLKRTEKMALLSELGLVLALKQHLGHTGDPMWDGKYAGLTRFFVGGGLITPLLLHFSNDGLGRRLSRLFTIVSSILVLAGGFAMRYVVIMAGHDSADDPEALLDMQHDS